MQKKIIAFSNFDLEYIIVGEGLPVFFIHGFGETYHIWNTQLDALKNKYKVIACNLPGTGHSDFFENTTPTLENYAQAIKKIVETENIHSFILIGHSMGGYITLAYLELFQKDLIGVGFIHSTCFPDTDAKIKKRKKSITFLQSQGSEAFLKQAFPDLFFNKENNQMHIEALVNHGKKTHAITLCSYYKAIMHRPNRIKLLEKIKIPVLFVAGQNDSLIPLGESLEQSYVAPITFFKILKKAAHMGMIEESEVLNETLVNYLTYVNHFNK